MDLQNRTYLILILIFVFISCKKNQEISNNPVYSFQNLICDYPINDSVKIKNVETFLIFGNSTNDTIKVSLSNIQKNYRHIYKKDTFKINFEAINSIQIPPHDSLGIPCMSIIEKKFGENDKIFKIGFSVINIKLNKKLDKTSQYSLEKMYEFQLYKKWGHKSNKVDL
ncbi:hypothetical protein [Chryseobacterium sp. Hurlbut01]|uniref:hypothetical protein n=1 Tax=Chryseobacterium sp. Hurlbut01 TaxID=1681828 RepID=UPI000A9CB498|nr:hypothetical protein [Chryseobacterium sp. Hurlbut01]